MNMKIDLNKIFGIATVVYLVVSMVFPRSYALFKLPLLFLFVFLSSFILIRNKKVVVRLNVVIFYSVLMLLGIIWSAIGFINKGSMVGIMDNFRLWVIWSVFYFIIVFILLQRESLILIHKAVLISAVLIFGINLIGLLNVYYGWNLLPESLIDELDLKVGFHDGYVQITTQNIASLFFIIPYLVVIQFRKDAEKFNTNFAKTVLILSLALAIFSGRRALWLCIIVTPVLIVGLSLLHGNLREIKNQYRKLTYTLVVLGTLSLITISQSEIFDNPTITHLKDAFSAEDERSIQKVYLLDSFSDYPVLGSGFGVGAGYVRNTEAPWIYELTYHQILFNFGIIGSLLIIVLIGGFLFLIVKNSNNSKEGNSLLPFCILIGVSSFAIGAYSNPYFGSFDFLIYISMIPYLSAINLNGKTTSINPIGY